MIQVNIDEKKVDNFTDQARDKLKEQMGKYADNIIKESNLIEESIREDGAIAEITSTIVMQAVRKSKNDTDYSLVIAPVVSDLCTTPVALSAPPNSYQNNSQS